MLASRWCLRSCGRLQRQRQRVAPLLLRRTAAAAAAASPPPPSPSNPPQQQQRLEGTPLDATLDGLQLLRQEFTVGGRALRVVCPADPDAVLDRYIEAGSDGDPYWTRVWPSAIALASELLARPQLVAGLRVADLGGALLMALLKGRPLFPSQSVGTAA